MAERSPQEMAWSDYIAEGIEDDSLRRRYIAETGRAEPICDAAFNSDEFWEWAVEHSRWLEGFRDWLTARWGYQFAPDWLQRERAN